MIQKRLAQRWTRFWMRQAGTSSFGRFATRLATWFVPPYKGRYQLAQITPRGYTATSASIHHAGLVRGNNVFIGDRVVIYENNGGGQVELGDSVHLNNDCMIEIGKGGRLTIGARTFVQPRCQFSAYVGPISIGANVQIAPHCAFYSYNHGTALGQPIQRQPLESRGGITIGDDVWLGYGVIVLDGVTIGNGAVIGAGAVVTRSIPANAIALGSPARVVRFRMPNEQLEPLLAGSV